MFGIHFAFGLSTTALVLLVGHWFPWPRRLPRLLAYSYGVGAILAGQAIWLAPRGRVESGPMLVGGLLAFAVVGGLAVALAYGVDAVLNLRIRAQMSNGRHE